MLSGVHLVSCKSRRACLYMSRKLLAMVKLDAPCIFQVTSLEVPWSFLPGIEVLLLDCERFFVASCSCLNSDAPEAEGFL